jgi:Flp pilus assembly protein TadD
MMYLFKNESKKGVADYDKAVLLDPADVNSWNNRGQGRMRIGDKQGAIADFRKALELKPGLPTALESLKKLGAAPQ